MTPEQLPDESGLNKPIQELKPIISKDELDIDRWAQDNQKLPDIELPEDANQVELSDDEVAKMGQAAAKEVVNSDLSKPQQTEMPDGTIYESPLNPPAGVEASGFFGQIEKRAYDDSRENKNEGWMGTAYVDPNALKPKTEVAFAPPPPPPPSDPPKGPLAPYDKNEMPPQDYDKIALMQEENEFSDSGEDQIANVQDEMARGIVKPDNMIQNQAILDNASDNAKKDEASGI
jgi:hypothetical protein